jgi:glyoxalase family protein
MPTSPGLHHVTAICSDAPRTRDFYERVLGLRLVKSTVNFDDPGTWHLYFGDETGGPGSVLTFFEWPTAEPGKPGAGQAVALSLAIPKGAAHGWVQRLTEEDVFVAIAPGADDALTFYDPDGLALELIEQDWAETLPGYVTGFIGEEQAIRGLAVVTLLVEDCDATASVLEEALGWRECARASHGGFLRLRFQAPGEAGPGRLIDVLKAPEAPPAEEGVGSIHHIAFRAKDDAAQAAMGASMRKQGLKPTEQRDRNYFRSIYAREPSGVLFEVATDGPGFAVDETPLTLGSSLRLPAKLEAHRAEIEAALPPLT